MAIDRNLASVAALDLLMRRLIPPASDQEIQPKECCCRCTESDTSWSVALPQEGQEFPAVPPRIIDKL
jgi:hypothetical protein